MCTHICQFRKKPFTEELGLLKEFYVVTVERINKEFSNKVQHNNSIQEDGRCGCHAGHTKDRGIWTATERLQQSLFTLCTKTPLIVEVSYSHKILSNYLHEFGYYVLIKLII